MSGYFDGHASEQALEYPLEIWRLWACIATGMPSASTDYALRRELNVLLGRTPKPRPVAESQLDFDCMKVLGLTFIRGPEHGRWLCENLMLESCGAYWRVRIRDEKFPKEWEVAVPSLSGAAQTAFDALKAAVDHDRRARLAFFKAQEQEVRR